MDRDQIKADLEYIVGRRAPYDGETMGEVLKRLDRYSTSKKMHERLKHYLSKRSYVKALAWFDDPEMPHHI